MDTILGSQQILARIGMRKAIDAVEGAFIALDSGHIGPPATLGIAVAEGSFHVKACAASPQAYAGLFVAKVNSNFPGNPGHGMPTIQGVVTVFDVRDGRLLALLDSACITSLRTAATTALVVRRLAREDSRTATLVGCGALGRFHMQALAECGIARVRLVDKEEGRAEALAGWARQALPRLECEAASEGRAATRESDVVVTCTSSIAPILHAADVRPGTLVAAVGADSERKSEIAPDLLARARIVADSRLQCLKIGDLRNAPPGAAVCGELTDVVAGRVARTAEDEIVLFDSTGLAVQDIALCALLVE